MIKEAKTDVLSFTYQGGNWGRPIFYQVNWPGRTWRSTATDGRSTISVIHHYKGQTHSHMACVWAWGSVCTSKALL